MVPIRSWTVDLLITNQLLMQFGSLGYNTNIKINHIKSCWNVTYKGNNVGARDYDFKLRSNEKKLVNLFCLYL